MKFSYHYLLQLNYYLAKLKHLCLIWKFCEWNWKPIYPCEPNYKNSCNILNYYRDYTEVWSCNTLKKKKKKKNLYFLVTNIFSVSKLIWWYLNMSFIDLATQFKIGMYLLNRQKLYQCFSEINRYNKSFKLIANR